jgi:hypothetical protein
VATQRGSCFGSPFLFLKTKKGEKTMKKYLFLCDVNNLDGLITKDVKAPLINRGEELQLDPESKHVQWLLEGKVIKESEDQEEDLLALSAQKVIDELEKGELTREELQDLLDRESADKKRKTVIEAVRKEIEKK